MLLSKIVVVVKGLSLSTCADGIERKEYPNAIAVNNERGELVIETMTYNEPADNPSTFKRETIAVFKEWLYWEKRE
jgi:hypothetical protein